MLLAGDDTRRAWQFLTLLTGGAIPRTRWVRNIIGSRWHLSDVAVRDAIFSRWHSSDMAVCEVIGSRWHSLDEMDS